jgi:shikimate dehydrogenase
MQLGLIGYPLGHSKSPEIFARMFEQNHIQGSYSLFPLQDISELEKLLKNEPDLMGFNITIPYKKAIFPFLDEVSEEAKAIGAVNTVKIEHSGNNVFLKGYNTDYYGFSSSLQSFLGTENPKKALVLGTGGSSDTVTYTLEQLGIEYTKVSRKKGDTYLTYENLTPEIVEQHSLIINTTPLGMQPDTESSPELPYEALTPQHYLFDLVYNPLETLFLQKGRIKGAKTKNGLEMLNLQARKSFEIWKD